MAGRGGDRGSDGREARRKGKPRVSAGGRNSETYVEAGAQALTVPADLEELYVDERLPKKGKKSNGKNGASAAKPKNGKSSSAKRSAKQGHRAAEKRRARGDVVLGPEAGTNTSLNQRQDQAAGESGQLKYATGMLTCVQGPEEGLALNLLEGSYTIGRGRDNSFVLKDIAASRQHLRIDVEGGQVTASDMGSGNGTRINGKTTQRFLLEDGDKVELGNSVFVFSRLGKGAADAAASSEIAALDAQVRIEQAAERLAAELGDRFKDPGAGEEDESSDAAPTATGRPRGRVKESDEKERGKRKPRAPMPDELWNDALTQVPLSEVVPADSPLGAKESSGPARIERAAKEPASSVVRSEQRREAKPPPPPPRARETRPAPPPRPTPPPRAVQPTSPPLPLPPRPPATTAPPTPAPTYGVVAEQPPAPAWTYVVLPALVVVLVLGTALGGWALYRFVNEAPPVAQASQAELEASMKLAFDALQDQQLDVALSHAQRAYELSPNNPTVVALLKSIRDKQAEVAAATKATSADSATSEPAPSEPVESEPAPSEPVESAPDPKAVAEAEASSEPAPAPPAPAPAAKAATKEPTVARAPPPREQPRVVKKAKPKPRQQPRRARRQSRGMSDDDAGDLYRQAVRLVRDNEEKKGCALLRKVAKEGPSGSNWKVKAGAAVGRYGCD